jgi:hypothetical protein
LSFDHLLRLSYNETEGQFGHIYNFLTQQKYHYLRRLGLYYEKKRKGHSVDKEPPSDPVEEYNRLFQEIFLGYQIVDS